MAKRGRRVFFLAAKAEQGDGGPSRGPEKKEGGKGTTRQKKTTSLAENELIAKKKTPEQKSKMTIIGRRRGACALGKSRLEKG